jgi:hypothetical protein
MPKTSGGFKIMAFDCLGQDKACQLGVAIDQHGAGTATALRAAIFGREIANTTAEHIQKILAIFREGCLGLSIQDEGDRLQRHIRSSFQANA